jgi:hypothetical protein
MAGPFTVDLKHCAKYKGEYLSDEPGWKQHKGECATGVQYVFAKAGNPLGLTRTWKEGVKVRGNKIKPGTAVASFRNGKFRQDHAAVFVKETAKGLVVWDQFNHPPKPWGQRTLYFKKNNDRSNNGDLFSTIVK